MVIQCHFYNRTPVCPSSPCSFARSRRSTRLDPQLAPAPAPPSVTAARKKAAAAKEKKEKDAALKRARDERNAGLRDFGGKEGLSNLNDPKDPKRVPVVKAIVLPGEEIDLTSAALPKSRIPPAPAPQGQQTSGGGESTGGWRRFGAGWAGRPTRR